MRKGSRDIRWQAGLTISGDGTSHRKHAYESRHVALRVPDYSNVDGPLSETPAVRLLGVDSTVDQSSDISKDGWIQKINDISCVFNESPLAQRTDQKLTLTQFARKLKGMNGDHANKEKSMASSINAWKQELSILALGEEAEVDNISESNLMQYLVTWNEKKVADAGGIRAWNVLSPADQIQREKSSQMTRNEISTSFYGPAVACTRIRLGVIGGPEALSAQFHVGIIEAAKRQLHALADKRKARAARATSNALDFDRDEMVLGEEMEASRIQL
ncbi:hypothetical protein BDZ97DRAFT_1924106 [Flammula alnicola]|nr:hypothetical protein BDZ97DRAFT_1924106 [Flammula alnicola]